MSNRVTLGGTLFMDILHAQARSVMQCYGPVTLTEIENKIGTGK